MAIKLTCPTCGYTWAVDKLEFGNGNAEYLRCPIERDYEARLRAQDEVLRLQRAQLDAAPTSKGRQVEVEHDPMPGKD